MRGAVASQSSDEVARAETGARAHGSSLAGILTNARSFGRRWQVLELQWRRLEMQLGFD